MCAVRTERAPVLVLQLPPLVEAGLGGGFLFDFTLAGHFGRALGAEVRGDVACEPPLGSKRGVAAPDYTLEETQT